jgi:hypothetical protein
VAFGGEHGHWGGQVTEDWYGDFDKTPKSHKSPGRLHKPGRWFLDALPSSSQKDGSNLGSRVYQGHQKVIDHSGG